MNTKLIGGVLLVGGVSVIAYYFLFSKKSQKKIEQDLLKKPEKNIDVDLKLTESGIDFTKNYPKPFDSLSKKELEEVYSNIENIGKPVINIMPIDIDGLEKLGLAWNTIFNNKEIV
jgi:hypothetical protein